MRIAYANLLPEGGDDRFLRAPLAAGYLAAYVAARRGAADAHDVVATDDLALAGSTIETTEMLLRSDPEVVALSVYLWNVEPVKRALDQLRRRSDAVVVLGGPEVQFTPDLALRRYDPDFVCTGEGEIAFLTLVDRLSQDASFSGGLPGMASRSAKASATRLMTHLDSVASPFAEGLIDLPKSAWLDLETTRGCPFSCAFCLYGKQLEKRRSFSMARVRNDLVWALDRGAKDLYFLDPTFNIPRDRCRDLLNTLIDVNQGRAQVYVEARAEAVDEDLADRLAAAGVTSVEVGLQAVDHSTLDLMNRSLGRKGFLAGCRRLRERGIAVDIGIILGLPGDSAQSIRETIDFVTQEPLGEVSAYRLRVLPGSDYWGQARKLGLQHLAEPPYYVQRTSQLTPAVLDGIEHHLSQELEDHNRGYRALFSDPRTDRASKKEKKAYVHAQPVIHELSAA